jgi:hypothetical protein
MVFPKAVIKPGLRIVPLSLQGKDMDEGILSSALHRNGEFHFFLMAVSAGAPEIRTVW